MSTTLCTKCFIKLIYFHIFICQFLRKLSANILLGRLFWQSIISNSVLPLDLTSADVLSHKSIDIITLSYLAGFKLPAFPQKLLMSFTIYLAWKIVLLLMLWCIREALPLFLLGSAVRCPIGKLQRLWLLFLLRDVELRKGRKGCLYLES